MITRDALAVAALLAVGCECGREPEPSDRPRAGSTRGDEGSPALAYPNDDAAHAEAFELVLGGEAPAALAGATRAGGWAALRHGGDERRSAGNFLCRLETIWGRAPIVLDDRAAFVLRDRESGLVVTAVGEASDAWFGAVLPVGPEGPDLVRQTEAAHVVLALAALLDATTPRDCSYTLAGQEVGVRDGSYH